MYFGGYQNWPKICIVLGLGFSSAFWSNVIFFRESHPWAYREPVRVKEDLYNLKTLFSFPYVEKAQIKFIAYLVIL